MRFLHTGDWHVGKPLRGRSRLDEFAAVLDEVGDVALSARVDAVLVAGDVYDSPAPPPEAERLVYDLLARLARERVRCVLIAGNHDHPRRLAALARLLEGLGIHVRAEVQGAGGGGLVTVPSRDGREAASVVAVPFVPERRVVDACEVAGRTAGDCAAAYAVRMEGLLAHLTAGLPDDTVNVLLAHLLVAGARVGTGERALHLDAAYALLPSQLPDGVQYVALGHLHRPQEVQAGAPTFYAGSLLELDFGEACQDKRVLLVEAAAGAPPFVESVPLRAGRRLRDVEGTLPELQARREELAGDWLRVRVRAGGAVPDLAEQVREVLPLAVDVQVAGRPASPPPPRPARAGLAPAALFREFYAGRNGEEPPEALLALFRSVYEEASQA